MNDNLNTAETTLLTTLDGEPSSAAPSTESEAEVTARFSALVKGCSPKLKWLALKLMKNDEEAKDVLQEAYIKAFRSFASFRGDASFSTWMHRIVTNAALNRLAQINRQSKVVTLASSVALDADGGEPGQSWLETASHDDTPEALLQAKETQDFLSRALSGLETEWPSLHLAFMAIVVEKREYLEVAAEFGVPLGTVRSRVHRARMYMLKALETTTGEELYA